MPKISEKNFKIIPEKIHKISENTLNFLQYFMLTENIQINENDAIQIPKLL